MLKFVWKKVHTYRVAGVPLVYHNSQPLSDQPLRVTRFRWRMGLLKFMPFHSVLGGSHPGFDTFTYYFILPQRQTWLPPVKVSHIKYLPLLVPACDVVICRSAIRCNIVAPDISHVIFHRPTGYSHDLTSIKYHYGKVIPWIKY